MLDAKLAVSARNQPDSAQATLIHSPLFQSYCETIRFQTGDLLRQKGLHYRDMYLTTDGSFEVDFEAGPDLPGLLISQPGSAIGEIGFLRGSIATATVRAASPAGALVIDDPALKRLEQEQPALASQLLHQLAAIAEERASFNLVSTGSGRAYGKKAPVVDVFICRNADMLESAKRMRYEVYCNELGRQSPYADHEKKVITDELDLFGNTFIAVEDGEVIGTLRSNEASLGPLGVLEDLYGMKDSIHHPQSTGICTKFIVKKAKRGGPAALLLVSAVVRYGLERNVKECYIDCIPALLPYYKAMGFTPSGQRFFHKENGPSDPLRLDLVKHGKWLSGEFGLMAYLGIFARAQFIKLSTRVLRLLDNLRGYKTRGA